jgi:hypothetical protein
MTNFAKPWKSLVADKSGIAILEFALSLPLLLILGLGGLEMINFVLSQMHVNRIAVMTADNASRLRSQMSESYVNQLFVGVEKAGASIDFINRGRVVLSSVQNNKANDGQWIRWQRCVGNLVAPSKYGSQGKGEYDTTLPSVNGLQAQTGSALMYVEVYYDYQPLFETVFFPARRMTREAAFIVRQRTDFSIAGSDASHCA